MTHDTMKISVIITTHNRATLLAEAIESALGQEPCGAEVEIIVVDDASTDDTAAVVASYPSLRYVWTRQGTCGGSRNAGIVEAQGEWIAILDDDDVWLPHKLKRCCEVIADHPRARMIFSGTQICDYQLKPARDWVWRGPELAIKKNAYEAFLDDLPAPSTVLLHRDIFDTVGLFATYAPRAEDRDMWFRLLLAGYQCAATPEPLILYRERERIDGEVWRKAFADTMTVLRRYFAPDKPRPPWRRRQQVLWRTRAFYALWLMDAGRQALRERRWLAAARYYCIAAGMSPPRVARSAIKGILVRTRLMQLLTRTTPLKS